MKINTSATTPVTISGDPIKEVDSFVYLGSVVDPQGGTDRDVVARIGKARAAFIMLKNIWASKKIQTRTKLQIFNSNVKSVIANYSYRKRSESPIVQLRFHFIKH